MPTNTSTNEILRNKKILITGGLGFVGSNLTQECLKMGARVTIFDSLDPKSGGNLYNIQDFRSDVNLVINDIRNEEGLAQTVLGHDIVFNCAAYTSHPNSMKEPILDIEVNCRGTINCLEAIRRFSPDAKFVQIGTSTQIGKNLYAPADEMHSEFPLDIYSANKSAAEKYTLIYSKAYELRTTVVRLANNFGPRSCIKSPEFGFINYFIGLALQNKEISLFGEGYQIRNFSFIKDSVNALITAATKEESNGEAFFAVSKSHISVAEVADRICSIVGGKVKKIPWPKEREVLEIGDATYSNEKIQNILGWAPSCELDDGLLITKNYYQDCLAHYL